VNEVGILLANEHVRAGLTADGQLRSLDDGVATAARALERDGWWLVLDGQPLDERTAHLTGSEALATGHVFRFRAGDVEVELVYHLPSGSRALRRWLAITTASGGDLTDLGFGPMRPVASPAEVVPYDTFWYCPTVTFLRWPDRFAWCAGIEEPNHTTDWSVEGLRQGYPPGLRLRPGARYVSDAQFLGMARLTGRTVVAEPPRSRIAVGEPWRRGRFRDPMGHVPIDRAEIGVMRAIVADFLGPGSDRRRSVLYTYWTPMPQPPLDASGEAMWHGLLDRFAGLHGDLLMTVPWQHPRPPEVDRPWWDVATPGGPAARLLEHARRRALGVGLYMGVAAGNLPFGNAAALDLPRGAPDAWKKVDEQGVLSGEPCMASQEWLDWSTKAQAETIARYDLAGWSWDPGPGSGRWCHATHHGHLPGQGGHLGWRNATELRRRLRERWPGLYLQAFYGQKEEGPWGLRHFDQHEAYWEQQVEWGALIHPDVSSDRIDADGIREQAWRSQNLRFLPARMNHALVGRITQYCMDDPELGVPWDHAGWRYALLSGLAVGGDLTSTVVPADPASVPGLVETWGAWLDWARRHQHLVRYDRALGSQVRPGGVDIHARVDGAEGVVFLANPAPRAVVAELPLDETLGLTRAGMYRLVLQTPARGGAIVDVAGASVFTAPALVEVHVPPHSVLVLALEPVDGASVDGPDPVDPADLPTTCLSLDGWTDDGGRAMPFPVHPPLARARLRTTIRLATGTLERIRSRRARDAQNVDAITSRWRAAGFPDTFGWARPDRLLFVVPFLDPDDVGEVQLSVAGRPVTIERFRVDPPGDRRLSGEPLPGRLPATTVCWWADVTDELAEDQDQLLQLVITDLAADQFLGPWLEVPGLEWDAADASIQRAPANPAWRGPVPDAHRPMPFEAAPGPAILDAWLAPDTLREGTIVAINVRVDPDAGPLAGVFGSTLVGPGVFTDVALTQRSDGTWTHAWRVGDRREVILDPVASHVWAVAQDGRFGDTRRIPMRWDLPPRDRGSRDGHG